MFHLDDVKHDFHRLDEKFTNRKSAEKLAQEWERKGYNTRVDSKNFNGRIIYQVYISSNKRKPYRVQK